MRKPKFFTKPYKTCYDLQEGETIETKVKRIVENKEPISDGAPIIFTNRDEGVIAAYNIRTDRWELAQDKMDAIAKYNMAKNKSFGVDKDKKEGDKKEEKTPVTEGEQSA